MRWPPHLVPSSRLGPFLLFLLGAVLFPLAYAQAPLYFSNQNQYFLHGLAAGGFGHLDQDWLANTADPTPLFSLLVAGTYRFLDKSLFHVYYALLLGVYFASLLGIWQLRAGERATPLTLAAFVALVVLAHSAVLRCASARLLGVDYPWYLQAGVAGQYVLGPMLQPSCFGVLLLLSLVLFALDRPYVAAVCASLGAVWHSTYLLPAAMLTAAYLAVLLAERRLRDALRAGLLALAVVSPVVVYNFSHFRPTSSETFADAARILVHFRIPHHAIPALWFDAVAALQVAWLSLGIVLARGTRLFPVLLIAFTLSAALTLLQVATGSDALALLFPWRLSVILVPAATAVIFARLVLMGQRILSVVRMGKPSRKGEATLAAGLSWGVVVLILAAAAAGGVAIMALRLGFQERDEELALMNHVREQAARGDVYLLPVPVPDLKASVSGSFKSDFKPLAELQTGQFIPVNLQRFRLAAGAAIYVDFKSIPYRDVDVLEWRRRLDANEQIYKDLKAGNLDKALSALRQERVTHLVVPVHGYRELPLPLEYRDNHYRLYRVP